MLSIAMGLRQSLGLFQTPVVQGLGLQAADFAMATAVQNIVWGLTQPCAGALIDRFGPRRVALLYAAGLAITAGATNRAMIRLGSGGLIGIALSCTTSGIASNVAARHPSAAAQPGLRHRLRGGLQVIPFVNGLVVQMFGIKFLSTLTGIAFLSHQVGSFLGAWGGGAVYDSSALTTGRCKPA
jgi:MFS family permease